MLQPNWNSRKEMKTSHAGSTRKSNYTERGQKYPFLGFISYVGTVTFCFSSTHYSSVPGTSVNSAAEPPVLETELIVLCTNNTKLQGQKKVTLEIFNSNKH